MRAPRELEGAMAAAQDRALARMQAGARIRTRLIATVAEQRARLRRARAGVFGLTLVGAAAAVAFAIARKDPAIQFVVDRGSEAGAAGVVGDWFAAPAGRPLPLRFSDGTSLALEASAVLRVADLDRRGGRLVLESGRSSVVVARRPGARWRLEAGPFAIDVTGTRFDVEWSPGSRALEVAMREGSVVVSGGWLTNAVTLTAGQMLSATPVDAHWQVKALAARPAPESEPSADRALGADPPAARAGEPAPGAVGPALPERGGGAAAGHGAASTRPSGWRALLGAGKYREAMSELGDAEMERSCRSDGPEDLLALGDAARLVGQPARARQALLALRRRFPRDGRASMAGFTLGRLAFDQRQAYGEAAEWFARYLREQPDGQLGREAAGRLVEARQLAGDPEGARAAARDYLRLYPSGPHAHVANRALGQP